MEYVQGRFLGNMEGLDIPVNELSLMFEVSKKSLEDFHARRVYHSDLNIFNLFWNDKRKVLAICDWEFARFDPIPVNVDGWAGPMPILCVQRWMMWSSETRCRHSG